MSKCAICGSENGSDARFCRACGAAFTVRPKADGALPADPAPEGDVAGPAVIPAAAEPIVPESTAVGAVTDSGAFEAAAVAAVAHDVHAEPETEEAPRQKRSPWMILIVLIPLMLLCGACFVMSLIGRML